MRLHIWTASASVLGGTAAGRLQPPEHSVFWLAAPAPRPPPGRSCPIVREEFPVLMRGVNFSLRVGNRCFRFPGHVQLYRRLTTKHALRQRVGLAETIATPASLQDLRTGQHCGLCREVCVHDAGTRSARFSEVAQIRDSRLEPALQAPDRRGWSKSGIPHRRNGRRRCPCHRGDIDSVQFASAWRLQSRGRHVQVRTTPARIKLCGT